MLPLRTFTANPSRFAFASMLVGEGGLVVETDMAYGSAQRHRLDVYRPPADDGRAPAALFLYGGGWRGGCRGCYGYVGAALAARGIPTAVADYRLFPEVRWPAFQQDAAAAWAWTRRHVADDGTRPVIVMGHSAGAHMAALLALDPRWHGGSPPAGLVGLSGPYDFKPTEWPTTRDIFATASQPDEPRPIAYVGRESPPSLLIHGDADTTVKPENTRALAAALRGAGVAVGELHLPGLGHVAPVVGFARPFRRRYPMLEPIVAFALGLADAGKPREADRTVTPVPR